MEFLYLSRKNVEDLGITMKEVLKVVEHGFRLKGLSKTEMPPKPADYLIRYLHKLTLKGYSYPSDDHQDY